MKYRSVALGGTFDRLHKGHKTLLSTAFTLGNHVTIGLTTDTYIQRHKSNDVSRAMNPIASFRDRKQVLEAWIETQRLTGRYTIVPLDDSYGPTVLEGTSFDVIIVSDETKSVADKINAIRKGKNLSELAVIVVPMVPAEDFTRISSTRIRNGDIDKEGKLVLPLALRATLKKSIGSLVGDDVFTEILKSDAERFVISVGDMTTMRLLENGLVPSLTAIDFQIERKAFEWDKVRFDQLTDGAYVVEMKSGPGYISRAVVEAIKDWFQHPGKYTRMVCIIDGEEDLLVLPLLLEAPVGSVLYYGQPKEGIVRVEVTREKKMQVSHMLSGFITEL